MKGPFNLRKQLGAGDRDRTGMTSLPAVRVHELRHTGARKLPVAVPKHRGPEQVPGRDSRWRAGSPGQPPRNDAMPCVRLGRADATGTHRSFDPYFAAVVCHVAPSKSGRFAEAETAEGEERHQC